MADAPNEASSSTDPAPSQKRGQPPTVLFVEDEESIREWGARALEGAGIPALTAATGREAGQVLNEHADCIGAIVLDMSLPDMSCREAYELLQAIRPGTPVIICTGYIQEMDLVEEYQPRVVLKPVTDENLIPVVRQTLNLEDPT